MIIDTVDTIKIRKIEIKNYKGIDELPLEFPVPLLPGDPDIMAFGSQNGLGKTSILECCALVITSLGISEYMFDLNRRYAIFDLPDLLVRAGASRAEIKADLVVGETALTIKMTIDRKGVVKIDNSVSLAGLNLRQNTRPDDMENLVAALCGMTPNPVFTPNLIFFHSYRRVQEGNPELGQMVERESMQRKIRFRGMEMPVSAFKMRVLQALMRQANLFEMEPMEEPEATINKLNELMRIYAHGTISKLRPSADNTVDFRIQPEIGDVSFTFDGLSSGQKEIISTLFLIWYHTKKRPCVVFIDEPELHLNFQWHRSFINNLINLAPANQYIIATHSEEIMDTVPSERRVLLINDTEQRK